MASCGGLESRLGRVNNPRHKREGGHCCDRSQAKECGLKPAVFVPIRVESLLEVSDTGDGPPRVARAKACASECW